MRPISLTILSVFVLISWELIKANPTGDEKLTSFERAKKLLDNNPLIDGHNDLPHMVRINFQNQMKLFDLEDMTKYKDKMNATNGLTHTDFKRIREGRLAGQFWAVYASCTSLAKDATRIHLEQVDIIMRYVEKYSSQMQMVRRSEEIKEAFGNKKIASLMGMESGHAIDSSLAVLRMFYELGVRYMTLTHNCNVPWATNHMVDQMQNASSYGGLTKFGRLVINEMNRLGMMVDLSHVSYQTMIDALNETKAPVIFSHSAAFSVCNQTRNVRDDVLLKLKENNGIIMINFVNGFVNCRRDVNTTAQHVYEHIDYVKKLIGVDYIGIGSDFDGVSATPVDLPDVSAYPNLFAILIENGWTDEEIIKLAGKNIIRVLNDVEKFADSVKSVEPIDDNIDPKDITESFKACRTSF